MPDCKPTDTPLPLAHTLYRDRVATSEEEQRHMATVTFRSILGSLIYLSTRTRPDISTAVSMLGKFQADPAPCDWKALKHLLRYLKGTVAYGVNLCNSNVCDGLQAYSDADWARDESARRSRSGILITYEDSPIFWISKMQAATATSTTEAEFSALGTCVREISWLRQLLTDIGSPESGHTTIYQDNLGAIRWSEDVQGLRRVKYVGIKYHVVRSKVDSGDVTVIFTSSATNRTDSLTKILGREMHIVHRRYLGVIA